MRLLSGRSRQRISPAAPSPFTRSAPYTGNEPSRHDAAMIGDRKIPVDPFVVWMESRDADELLKRETDQALKGELESLLQRS
jgi:hypothetical protein